MAEDSRSGWVGYVGDELGRPARDGNDHLTDAQREELTRPAADRAQARGRRQVVVRVDVYENGDTAPQVRLPDGSTVDPLDRGAIRACVDLAAEALPEWR